MPHPKKQTVQKREWYEEPARCVEPMGPEHQILRTPGARRAYNRVRKALGEDANAFFIILLKLCASMREPQRMPLLMSGNARDAAKMAAAAKRLYEIAKDHAEHPSWKNVLTHQGGFQGTVERWVADNRIAWSPPLPATRITDDVVVNALAIFAGYLAPFSQPQVPLKGRPMTDPRRITHLQILDKLFRARFGPKRPMLDAIGGLMEATWGGRWTASRVKMELHRAKTYLKRITKTPK